MEDPSASYRGPRPPGRPPRTSVDALVDAAVAIGLDRFTLTEVAGHVGIAESTAYGYVAGRDELYAVASASVLAGLDLEIEARTWVDYVDEAARRIVALARTHPGLAAYVLFGPYQPSTLDVFERMLGRVRGYVGSIDENVVWMITSRPVTTSLTHIGDPVLESASPWLRRSLLDGLDARLRAGELPDPVDASWRDRLGAGVVSG